MPEAASGSSTPHWKVSGKPTAAGRLGTTNEYDRPPFKGLLCVTVCSSSSTLAVVHEVPNGNTTAAGWPISSTAVCRRAASSSQTSIVLPIAGQPDRPIWGSPYCPGLAVPNAEVAPAAYGRNRRNFAASCDTANQVLPSETRTSTSTLAGLPSADTES